MNQTWENGEKPDFRPDLASLAQFSVPKVVKNLILGLNYARWAQIPVTIFFFFFFFFSIWLSQSIDFMGNYHYVQYQKKLMIQPWENLVKDGRADRRADGQMAESDLIGRCSTLSVHK